MVSGITSTLLVPEYPTILQVPSPLSIYCNFVVLSVLLPFTVKVMLAVNVLSELVAVILAVPSPTAFTTPLLTVSTLVLPLVQFILLKSDPLLSTAFNVNDCPTSNVLYIFFALFPPD